MTERKRKKSLHHVWKLVVVLGVLTILWIAFYDRMHIFRSSGGYRIKLLKSFFLDPGKFLIHQSWKTKSIPARLSKWSSTWRTCFPDAEFILWTDSDNREFIRTYYPWFLNTYDSFPENIHRADAVRYFYLFHFGGLYVDLDTECLKPFKHLLTPYRIVFGAMDGHGKDISLPEGHVQNSLMYSKPGEPFWLEIIRNMMNRPKNGRPEETTGPDVLMDSIRNYRSRIKSNQGMKIYPPIYFNPFSWLEGSAAECQTFNMMSDEQLKRCRQKFRNSSYVIQYHAHTWGGGKIV